MLLQGRRIAASICAVALTVSLSTPVLASVPQSSITVVAAPVTIAANPVKVTITQDEAIKLALSTFDIPSDFGSPQVNRWEGGGNTQPTWNLAWEKDPRLGGTMLRYTVDVNASSGEVTHYGSYRQDPNGEPLAKYSREEALPLAHEFLTKLVPSDKVSQLKFDDVNRFDSLVFAWTRQVNGYPFINNSVMIAVDGVDGSLREYNYTWENDLQFPAADKIMDQAQAQALYNGKVGPQLVYQQFYTSSGRNPVQLVYRNKLESAVVDAVTGQVTTMNGQPWSEEAKPIALGKSAATLTKLEKALSKEQALELARKVLGQDAAGAPNSSAYNDAGESKGKDSGPSVATWNFHWSVGEKESGQSKWLYATVDLIHGVLLGFGSDGPYLPDEKVKDLTPVAEETARKTAIEALKAVRPDILNQVELLDRSAIEKYDYIPVDMPRPVQREYNFNFTRLVNDIPYSENGVRIAINRFTGVVTRFNCNWSEQTFPDPQSVKVSNEDALKVFTTEQPLRSVYYWAVSSGYDDRAKPTIRLVYQPYNPWGGNFVDAVSGHFMDYSYKDITELRRGATDIADQPAKKEIQRMVDRGVFDTVDGKFNPTATMTRGELAKALVIAFNPGRPIRLYDTAMITSGTAPMPSYADVNYDNGYFGYVDAAVKAGILIPKDINEKLNPDELVTNEEMALLTVRAMGYGAIGNLKTVIGNAYTDDAKIAAEYRNAVGLLAGLEVLPNEGELNPQAQVTRAEAARLLANALQKAQNNRYYW